MTYSQNNIIYVVHKNDFKTFFYNWTIFAKMLQFANNMYWPAINSPSLYMSYWSI